MTKAVFGADGYVKPFKNFDSLQVGLETTYMYSHNIALHTLVNWNNIIELTNHTPEELS